MAWCNKLDTFCYVCGHMVPKQNRKSRKQFISEEFKLAYTLYFTEPDFTHREYTPNTVCSTCYHSLLGWAHKRGKSSPYMKPVIWREDADGHDVQR